MYFCRAASLPLATSHAVVALQDSSALVTVALLRHPLPAQLKRWARQFHMLRSRMFLAALTLLAGVALGGYLFSDSQPRSFLAVWSCDACTDQTTSRGYSIRRDPESGCGSPTSGEGHRRCVAIEHPFRRQGFISSYFRRRTSKALRT